MVKIEVETGHHVLQQKKGQEKLTAPPRTTVNDDVARRGHGYLTKRSLEFVSNRIQSKFCSPRRIVAGGVDAPTEDQRGAPL
jgi:hypothetical protein